MGKWYLEDIQTDNGSRTNETLSTHALEIGLESRLAPFDNGSRAEESQDAGRCVERAEENSDATVFA
jgi:hypothetical protein